MSFSYFDAPSSDFVSSGTAMSDQDSMERFVEGLKIAADAAAHLAVLQRDLRWGFLAHTLDKVRNDGRETQLRKSSSMSPVATFQRHIDGLKQAAGGARQLAVYHRMDTKWLTISKLIEEMEAKSVALARRKVSRRTKGMN